MPGRWSRGAVPALFDAPRHPYTEALLARCPSTTSGGAAAPRCAGIVPGAYDRPAGCLLSPRCPYVQRALPRDAAAAVERRRQPGALLLPAAPRRGPRSAAAMSDAGATCRCSRPSALTRTTRLARLLRSRRRRCARSTASRFALEPGRTLAVVGESGCGKSTLARQVTMIETPTAGALSHRRRRRDGADARARARCAAAVQMVFQNPYASLNPRKNIGHALEEPLAINTDARPRRARRARRGRCSAQRGPARPSTTGAIRTCSPAASASASRSRAR